MLGVVWCGERAVCLRYGEEDGLVWGREFQEKERRKGERGKGEEGDAVKLNYIARVEWVNRGVSGYFGIGARM